MRKEGPGDLFGLESYSLRITCLFFIYAEIRVSILGINPVALDSGIIFEELDGEDCFHALM